MGGTGEPASASRSTGNNGTEGKELVQTAVERPGRVPEIDSMRAAVQKGFAARTPHLATRALIEEASRLNTQLHEPADVLGPLERSAIAGTLFQMYDELQQRLTDAAAKQMAFPPNLPGVQWKKGDPLAGMPEGISPFHMHNFWLSDLIASTSKQAPKQVRQRRTRQLAPSLPGVSMGGRPVRHGEIPVPHLADSIPGAPRRHGRYSAGQSVAEFLAKTLLPEDWKGILRGLELAWKLLNNWARAKERGIDEAAHDIAIYVAVACLAEMASKVSENPQYTLPDPDYRWYQPTLDGWLKHSNDKPAAKAVHAKGIQLGTAAAKTIMNKAEQRTVEIRGFYLPDGRLRICRGLERARPDAVLLLPPQGYGVMWLRSLKKRYKTRSEIYGYLVEKLAKEGVRTRYGEIMQRRAQ